MKNVQPLYGTETTEREQKDSVKKPIPTDFYCPAVDLDALLRKERNATGLPHELTLVQIVGLWQLGNSYWYNPGRKAWDEAVSLLSANVRTFFREDGSAEEYEAEFNTGNNPYHYDSERRTLTWEGCEHYIVGLSPSHMEVITYEPITSKHPYEEIHKFVYNKIGE